MSAAAATVLITGGAAGIGLEIARAVTRRGARALIWDIDTARLEKAATELPGSMALRADISDPDAVKAAIAQGPAPTHLVNNAGILGADMSLNAADADAIDSVDGFKGLNFRVMQNPIFIDTFRRLGANPVPMAFGKVFTALETGAVDGQENPIPLIQATKFYEVQEYLTLTRHAYSPTPVLMAKSVWDGLNADEQKLVADCAAQARDPQIARSREVANSALEELKGEGMEVSELPPAEIEKLHEIVAPVYEASMEAVGKENFDLLTAELQKLRGN